MKQFSYISEVGETSNDIQVTLTFCVPKFLILIQEVLLLSGTQDQNSDPKENRVLQLWAGNCCSVMSDSLQPHGLQHLRLPCPSPSLGACSNSCPLSQWCHPTISSSIVPFFSCLQSFPASGSLPVKIPVFKYKKYQYLNTDFYFGLIRSPGYTL